MNKGVVAVFGSSQSQPGDGDYESGVEVGRLLAEAGYAVTNGGYGGLMEATSVGASGAGGQVIGVTAPSLFPSRPRGNDHLTDEVQAKSLTERIHIMSESACAAIVLPGSIGTFTELMVVWNDALISTLRGDLPRPIVAMRPAWQKIVEHLSEILGTRPDLVTLVDTPAEAVVAVESLLTTTGSVGGHDY